MRYIFAMLNWGHNTFCGSFDTEVLAILTRVAKGFHPLKEGGGCEKYYLDFRREGEGCKQFWTHDFPIL